MNTPLSDTDPASDATEQDGESNLTSQVAARGGLVLVGRLTSVALAFLFRALATNLLGAAVYGVMALAMSIVSPVTRLGGASFDRLVLRFGAAYQGQNNPAGTRTVVYQGMALGVALGLLTGVACVVLSDAIAAWFRAPQLAQALRILGVSLPFYAAMAVAGAGLQVTHRMRSYVLWGVVCAVAISCITLPGLVWVLGPKVESVALAQAIGWGVAGVGGAVAVFKTVGKGPLVTPSYRTQTRFMALTVLFVGANQIQQYIDRLMLGALVTTAEVGVYDIAAGLTALIPIILTAFNTAIFPTIGSLYHGGKLNEMRSLYRTMTRWILTLTLPSVLIVLCMSEWLLRIFGEEFQVGWVALSLLAIAQLFNVAVGPVGGMLLMTNKEHWLPLNSLVAGGFNVMGNYLLIPHLGIVGAALSTGLAIVLWNMAALIQVYGAFAVWPFDRHYWKPLLGALLGLAGHQLVAQLLPGLPGALL
ncbi:MAG: flippase, partial [Myxococcota bacterium]